MPCSDTAARAMRHRLRNDLQTLSSLCRLAQRRAPAEELAAAFPRWLDVVAAVHDLPAPLDEDANLPLRGLAESLARRTGGMVRVVGDAEAPSTALLALGLGVDGLLAHARGMAGPAAELQLLLDDGLHVTFPLDGRDIPSAPPLTLALAAEGLRGSVDAIRRDSGMTISLTYPCP